MQHVRARAPVRIDLAGGTLDIWPLGLCLPHAATTVGAALELPVEATVAPRAEGGVVLRSDDLGQEISYADVAALRAALAARTCPLPLLGHAVLLVCGEAGEVGLTLTTRAAPPPGSGLGTSSALLCAVLGALRASVGAPTAPETLQREAQDLETVLMRTPTGYQDYYPPLYGGCLALVRRLGDFTVEPLPVDLEALGRRLRLVYTGEPHVSGITNWGVLKAYLDGDPTTVGALDRIAGHAVAARVALRDGDLDGALQHVLADGRERRQMAPGVTTPAIETLDAAARAAGALGTKICGAGGGGCVLVVLRDPSQGPDVDAALAAGPGRPLPLRLTSQGLALEHLAHG